MPQCAVITCGNTYRRVSNVRYHRFPSHLGLRELWKQVCGRTGTEYNCETGRVCSLHFSRDSYEKDLEHELLKLPPRTRLRHGAVPDVKLPGADMPNLKPKIVKRKLNVKKQNEVQNGKNPLVANNNKKPVRIDDSLNVNGRPVRKKKKTEKYSAYEKDGRQTPDRLQKEETNLLLALGLTPVKRDPVDIDLNKMHVMEEGNDKGRLAETAEESKESPPSQLAADSSQIVVKNEIPSSPQPAQTENLPSLVECNGEVTESGVKCEEVDLEDEECLDNSRVSAGSDLVRPKSNNGLEILLVPSSEKVKESQDKSNVESTLPEAQDLTVTCTTHYDVQQKTNEKQNPKVISISVEQCQKQKLAGRKRNNKSVDSVDNNNEKVNAKKTKLPDVDLVNLNDDREQWISEYLDKATGNSLEDLQKNSDKLQQEIHSLSALARKKEIEWNHIIRLKKVKEEMYLRLLRRKQVAMFMMGSQQKLSTDPNSDWDLIQDNFLNEETSSDFNLPKPHPKIPSTLTITRSQSSPSQNMQRFLMQPHNSEMKNNNQSLMMVPIVSSTPLLISSTGKNQQNPRSTLKIPIPPNNDKLNKNNVRNSLIPILPKPNSLEQNSMLPKPNPEHSPPIGRQGPIVDVKTLIADYRQQHPEQIPRRGRRLKDRPLLPPSSCFSDNLVTSSRNVLSMSSFALGSGSQVRTVGSTSNDYSYIVGNQDNSRPSSADSNRSNSAHNEVQGGQSGGNVSFKDVLVEFAKRSQSDKKCPIYPEVTLHPVLPSDNQSPPNTSSSLLHGILTKNNKNGAGGGDGVISRSTTFSPTLARLLTTPERPPTISTSITTTAMRGASTTASCSSTSSATSSRTTTAPHVNISDILSSSKQNRNELTITAVISQSNPHNKQEATTSVEEDADEGTDRLIIDETEEQETREDEDMEAENVPQCQGCQMRSAQFVCAGCSNQWYCSRSCQVTAWDEHSEICSG